MKARFQAGPVGFFTVAPGAPNMGKNLGIWFVYSVFRITATVAWAAYGFATISESIRFARPWSQSMKQVFDALLYGLVTGGAFGWLWP